MRSPSDSPPIGEVGSGIGQKGKFEYPYVIEPDHFGDHPPEPGTMADPQLVLKTTPPRVYRAALSRERLTRRWSEIRDRTAVAVVAPRGFGKTTLLVQWRRLWLEQGALVAWVSLDDRDEPTRFASALLYAMRLASGRASFDALALQYAGQPDSELDSLTEFLSEIAALATPTVLVLDEADRLPDATLRESLAYLLLNAPSNLHFLIGSRSPLKLPTWDLAAHGNFSVVKTEDLRFDLDESIMVLDKRFGARLDLDDRVRLHEATEGWPIGLQLAMASIERAPDLRAAVASLSARHGDIERYFIESLWTRLPASVSAFLVRIAILERIEPELCDAVTGGRSAAETIDLLLRETPILVVAETSDWIRLHTLARDFLLGQFEQLPLAERQACHRLAANWLATRKRFDDAGRHALAAGDAALARTCAERCLFDLAKQGRFTEALEWLERVPHEARAADVDLRLASGWVMALCERPAQALEIAATLADDAGESPPVRFQAAMIGACAASFADLPGVVAAMLERWPEPPQTVKDPIDVLACANVRALMALLVGDTDQVRRLLASLPAQARNSSLQIAVAHGRAVLGLSYMWDGNVYKAEKEMGSALVEAERHAGRRSVIACTLAPMAAAALLARDQPAAAQALLANRLDVIEHATPPDAVLLAYLTLARCAMGSGDDRRAFELLDNLKALGESRRMPRLVMTSLAWQVRMHAQQSRAETASRLASALEAMAPRFAHADLLPLLPLHRLTSAIANAYAAIGRQDFDAAESDLADADTLAAQLHRGYDALTVRVLRAVVARQRDSERALPLLAEALSLAAIGGNTRLLADTHPLAVQMAAELQGNAMPAKAEPAAGAASPKSTPARPQAVPLAGMLTPKEAEMLGLLDNGLSNKVIARTLGISDETVKWHLKNLFSKLSAGTRRHAVDRARLLGLLVD